MLSGHRNLAVRWIAYTVFSLEVLYLAFETIGTMIGTASFFLSAGVLVLLLAAFRHPHGAAASEKESKKGR